MPQGTGSRTSITKFEDTFSEEVWRTTYKDHNDETIDDTLYRVASAAASVEKNKALREEWTEKFYDLLSEFKSTSGGRIYSNAGTEWKGTTLMNCFVSPRRKHDIDSLDGIIETVRNQSFTLKSEGGWGENFSYIRPRGSFIHGIGVESPGAVKYMEMFDKSSEIITSGSGKKAKNKKAKGKIRKGAMMGVLDVWHPDIVEFITAKQQPGRLTKFNISVNCTDEFMEKVLKVIEMKREKASEDAIYAEDTWLLRFPDTTFEKYKEEWNGSISQWEAKGYPTEIVKTVSATWLWNLIMESTYNRAEPGVLFLDRANHFGPLNYAETIFATNPCLVGDTLVSTNRGLVRIDSIVQDPNNIKVLTSLQPTGGVGNNLSSIINARCTGFKNVVRVQLSNGMEIRSTPDHRFWTVDGEYIEAQHLIGKSLELIQSHFASGPTSELMPVAAFPADFYRQTGITLHWTTDIAFMLGWMVGDGWITNNTIGMIFGKDDGDALDRIQSILGGWGFNPKPSVDKNNSTTLYINNKALSDMFRELGVVQCRAGEKRVPNSIFSADKRYVSAFLDGLFSADGSVLSNANSNYWVSLCSKSKQLLNDVQQLLLTFGITHHTTYDINKTSMFEYETVSGEQRQYIGGKYYDLRIFGLGIRQFFENINFTITRKQQKLAELQNKRFKQKTAYVDVVGIVEDGKEPVYDITVPTTHNFVAGGVVVHNCGEQMLAPAGVCNLGSLNLTQFVNKDRTGFNMRQLKKYVRYMNRFLDNINDLSEAPLPEYVDSMRNKRRVGIGILGWGSALFMLKVRFGSERAAELREQVMKTIAREAYMSSIDLAEEKGKFKYCDPEKHAEGVFVKSLNLPKEYMGKLRTVGIRNSSLLSIQPTGNTSILANVVSGGLEPIFMPEYVRTVIVNTMPEEIADVCPKWYEGEWHETSMFKFAKEGDEEILKGKHGGITYKIDKNRGLTKEVLCQDYGVRYLAKRGEWDPKADWAVTTANMTVEDHVSDLQGFARWVDSAMSKTVNVPQNYPLEKFKDIYIDSFKSGYVKGVTTYRSGTMTTVLAAKDEKDADASDEEIIKDDVKLPDSSPAVMKTLRAEGRKWYLTVVYHEDNSSRPFALFVKTNSPEKGIVSDEAIDLLMALAKKKGIPKRHRDDVEAKLATDTNSSKVARLISFLLRHGVLIKNVVATLDKVESAYVGTFVFQIKKFLSSYIKDGEKVEDEKCQECGAADVVFSEGCKKCMSCGSSKCG